MKFKVLTTQKEVFNSFLKTGLTARGIEKGIIQVEIKSLYDYANDRHRSIDDSPYGGGAGMVIRVNVVDRAISTIKPKNSNPKTILLTPQGKRFSQADAKRLAQLDELILISGRFEGFDERIRNLVDEEISIGDFVLTSGDLPAMMLIDAISREITGFIDRRESTQDESFSISNIADKPLTLLEYPQYTRPENYKGKRVPKVLLSGNHAEVKKWRLKKAFEKTQKRRDDLLRFDN